MSQEINSEQKELSILDNFKLLFGASRGYKIVNAMNFLDGIAYFGIIILLTRFLHDRVGMSTEMSGFSVSTFSGLVTLFMFGGGFVTDKLGVRRSLTWCIGIMGVGRLLITLAPSLGFSATGGTIVSWTGLLLLAMGQGVLQPTMYAGVKEYTDPRTATIGYAFLYAIMNLGIIAEHFVSPFIRTDAVFLNLKFTEIVGLGWGIDGVFWMCTAVTGLMLLINVTFFTKKIELSQRTVAQEAQAEINKNKTVLDRLKELPFLDVRFMFFIFILLPVRTIFAHQFLTMPDYIFRCFPEAINDKYEWIVGLNPLIIVIFVPLFAIFTRRMKIIDMMIIGTTVTALTGFFLVPGPQVWALLTYVIVFSLGEAMWSSRFLEYVAHIAPAGRVGAYMGLAGIPWFLAKFTTGWYSGSMIKHFIPENGPQDSSTMWLCYTLFACITPIVLILTRKWTLAKDS
ncbi:MAG: MFS transporter, partial [bacterium]